MGIQHVRDTILPGVFNIDDLTCQYYLSQLAEAIHFYGGKACMQIGGYVPVKYDVSPGCPSIAPLPIITCQDHVYNDL